MINKLKNSFAALQKAKAGNSFRDKLLCSLLVLFARSWHRYGIGFFLKSLIALFSKDGQILLVLKQREDLISISLRKNNGPDYRMAITVLLFGEYALPSLDCPKTIVDAGANIGAFTILAHSLFPGSDIICYEPDESNYSQLKLNLGLNKIDAISKNEGVWFDDRVLWFHPDESHKGFVSTETSEFEVKCSKPPLGKDVWLKMDIEGGEFEVLPPLISEVDNRPSYIFLEVHWGKNKNDERNKEFLRSIEKSCYTSDVVPNFDIFSESLVLRLKQDNSSRNKVRVS